MFVSVTRLRLRSALFLPGFALHAWRTGRQVRRSAGFVAGALLNDRRFAFWTLTAWRDEAAMRAYMLSGPHAAAMPHLMRWCDEASVAHWTQEGATLPDWTEADRRLRLEGRPSRLRRPSDAHAALRHEPPRTRHAVTISPAAG